MPTTNTKRLLTAAIIKEASVIAGRFEGRSETKAERLARVLWSMALGYDAKMIVGGETHVKTMLPNLGAQAIILDRAEGKVPSCNADEEVGVPTNTPAAPSDLTVSRLNVLSSAATKLADQTVQ